MILRGCFVATRSNVDGVPLSLQDSKPPVEVYERDDLVYSEGSGCYESDDDDTDCGAGESNSGSCSLSAS